MTANTIPTPQLIHSNMWITFAAAALSGQCAWGGGTSDGATCCVPDREAARRAADAADLMVVEYVKRFEKQQGDDPMAECPF